MWSVISYSTKALNHALPIRLEWLQTHSLPTGAGRYNLFCPVPLFSSSLLFSFFSPLLHAIYTSTPLPPRTLTQCWVDWELQDNHWFTFGLTLNFFVHMFFIAMLIILRAMTLLWRNVPGLRETRWNSVPHDISVSSSQCTPVDYRY